MTSPARKLAFGAVALATSLALIATSPAREPCITTAERVPVSSTGTCGAATDSTLEVDGHCNVTLSNAFGRQLTYRGGIKGESPGDAGSLASFSFTVSPADPLDAGSFALADGGVRAVVAGDEVSLHCSAAPGDAGHDVTCSWSVCGVRNGTFDCTEEPSCRGTLSPAR